jgi:hypothetical protein
MSDQAVDIPVPRPRPKRAHAVSRKLLDGTRTVDSRAAKAIETAFGRRSNDPVLHAAALLVSAVQGADLRLERSHARGWILGVQELLGSGCLDAVAYAIPRLQAAFPGMPYLEHIGLALDQMPPLAPGREPFVDDRERDVQVVRHPGADAAVLAFCGARHQLGLSLNLLDRWLGALGTHVIYLRDRDKIGYAGGIAELGADLPATVTALHGMLRDLGVQRVACIGNSAGGTGALHYAPLLGASRVLALAPLTGDVEPADPSESLPPETTEAWTDLVPLYRAGGGVRARILYGEKNEGDRRQSVRMAGLPGVTVEAVPEWDSHHLIGGLLRAERLDRVFGWLTATDDVLDFPTVSSSAADLHLPTVDPLVPDHAGGTP